MARSSVAGSRSKTQAAAKAQAAVARRAAAFQQRERELRALIEEFHDAVERADTVKAGAEAKAKRVLKDAETKAAALRTKAMADAAGLEEQAREVVRRMLDFGETRDQVSDITGWTSTQVRDAARPATRVPGEDRAAPAPEAPARARAQSRTPAG
jgi:hypothetical protein